MLHDGRRSTSSRKPCPLVKQLLATADWRSVTEAAKRARPTQGSRGGSGVALKRELTFQGHESVVVYDIPSHINGGEELELARL